MTSQYLKISDAYDISSNSPGVNVDKSVVSHVVKALPDHQVVVLKPRIDKMKINISGLGAIKLVEGKNGYEYWQGVYGFIRDILKTDEYPNLKRERVDRYKIGFQISLQESAGKVVCGLDPVNTDHPALTIEFNPSKFDATSVYKFCVFWDEVTGGDIPFPRLLWSATCSRVDVAFDLLNLSISDLFVYRDDLWKVQSFGTYGKHTETQRYYRQTGHLANHNVTQVKKGKRADLAVYDKKAEQVQNNIEPEFGPLAHTRVEFLIDRKGGYLRTLGSLKFPKKKWKIRRIVTEDTPFELAKWRMFLDSARFRGRTAATALLSENERAELDQFGEQSFPDDLLVETSWKGDWLTALEVAHLGALMTWAKTEPHNLNFDT